MCSINRKSGSQEWLRLSSLIENCSRIESMKCDFKDWELRSTLAIELVLNKFQIVPIAQIILHC